MNNETLSLLDCEREALLAAVRRVPVERRGERPGGDRWSIAEVLEHLATVERGIARLLAKRGGETPSADQAPAVPLDAARVDTLRSRAERREAPERVRPTGTISAEEALGRLEESRRTLREAVAAARPETLDGCTHPHPALGMLTLRDWVHFVAHHEARHVAQLDEIADALDASRNVLSPRMDS